MTTLTPSVRPAATRLRRALRHPPTVPPDFWESDELQAAFATAHMGKVIYAYRHHSFHGPSPLSQELVGRWANMTQAQLSRIENGKPIHDLRKLVYWAQTLGIPVLEALRLRPVNRVRNRAFDLTGLARTYLIQGQVDGVCEVAVQALPLAKRLGSRRILNRLADLSQEAAPYSGLAAVCDLRERIADVLRV